jgi:hypothetical protein
VKSDFQDAKKRLAEIFSSSQDDEYW